MRLYADGDARGVLQLADVDDHVAGIVIQASGPVA